MDQSKRPHPVTTWCENHNVDFRTMNDTIDPVLAKEASEYAERLDQLGRERLAGLPVSRGQRGVRVGGPALYELLYFLVRHLRPAAAVETGVAAGWSSRAILDAMHANNHGRLVSIDLPFSRLERMADKPHLTDDQVGIMVDEQLRDRWTLLLGSDQEHLPEALRLVGGEVDFFHYDSDKEYEGRERTMATVEPALSRDATVVFDDIRDNSHFADYVRQTGKQFAVVGMKEGLVGPLGHIDPAGDHGVPWPPVRKGRIRGHRGAR